MEFVEPIRNKRKIDDMKKYLYSNKRDYLFFVLGINTALRATDLLSFKYKDIIEQDGKPLEHIKLRDTKTGKHNKIILSPNVIKAINEYIKEDFDGDLEKYLFRSRKGENQPLTRQGAWQILKKASKAVGIRDIGIHSLRKTWAYQSYKSGTHLAVIQDMLNHSSIDVTLRYIGITQDEKDKAVMALNL
jgi:integrase